MRDATRILHAWARMERQRLFDMSLAMRAAQADEKGWRAWLAEVSAWDGR